MAVTLAFGVLFSTLVTLLLVPIICVALKERGLRISGATIDTAMGSWPHVEIGRISLSGQPSGGSSNVGPSIDINGHAFVGFCSQKAFIRRKRRECGLPGFQPRVLASTYGYIENRCAFVRYAATRCACRHHRSERQISPITRKFWNTLIWLFQAAGLVNSFD